MNKYGANFICSLIPNKKKREKVRKILLKKTCNEYNIQAGLTNLETEIKEYFNQQLEDIKHLLYSSIVNIRATQMHPMTFGSYKNCNIGKNVVLILGGPTIKYFEPIENAIYATVNNCCQYNKVDFDYLFLQELHKDCYKNTVANSYNNKKCTKFYGILPDNRLSNILPDIKKIPQSDITGNNIKQYYLDDRYAYQFAYDLNNEPIGDFGGSAFSAMQFILWTKPTKIYIVGADCSDKGNAFYNPTIPLQTNWHIEQWKKLKQFIIDIYPSIEVISINPIGLKGLFKDVYTERYLKSLNNKESVN